MIKKLSLKLNSGLLTPLQSDTIYGHFCWRLVEAKGEDCLKDFLKLYLDRQPVFTISDGMFEVNGEVLFPKPLDPTLDTSSETLSKVDRIKRTMQRKDLKGRRFITVSQLNEFLDGNLDKYEDSLLTGVKPDTPQLQHDIRFHVKIDRNTQSNEDSMLFQTNPQYLSEGGFAILIKVINEKQFNDYDVPKIMKEVFEVGFGKKKSSGYGAFSSIELSDYDKISVEKSDCNRFITLGNYLPSQDDGAGPGYYDYLVKYGKLGESGSSGNPFKRPVILFKPGSCFTTKSPKDFYGRITEPGEISPEKSVHQFGMPLTLNYMRPD